MSVVMIHRFGRSVGSTVGVDTLRDSIPRWTDF